MNLLQDISELHYDWVEDMKNTPQDPAWHAEGNVYEHTKMVIEEVKKHNDDLLCLSALFHDIEKRTTTKEEVIDGVKRITAPRHPKVGEFTTREILYRDFNFDFKKREEICKMVKFHGVPTWSINDSNYHKKIINCSLYVSNDKLIKLALADVMGRISPDKNKFLENIALYEMACDDLNCKNKSFEFYNSISRLKYLNDVDAEPTLQLYDDYFEVIMLSALPGMGKDTYYREKLSNFPMVSLDDLRKANKVKRGDNKGNGRVIQEAMEICKKYLRKKETFVFNATNVTKEMRSKWLNIFHNYGAKTRIIYIEQPYDVWKKQNKERENVVPDEALDFMMGILQMPGFDEAHEIDFEINLK